MSLFQSARTAIREGGIKELLRRTRNWAGKSTIAAIEGEKRGVSILDEDWDNLIVLDACRYDSFERVNTIPGQLERRTSRASVTWSFVRQNFEGRRLHDTVYVSGNAVVGKLSDIVDPFKFVGLWDDDDPDIVDPQEIVDRALELQDSHPNKRLIVHFLRPHTPFLVKDGSELPPDSKYRDYRAAMAGRVSTKKMWDVYEENLELVLRHVEELVEVPWLEVGGDGDRKTIVAENTAEAEMDDSVIDDQLHALGYK